jgi:hypothetical protein
MQEWFDALPKELQEVIKKGKGGRPPKKLQGLKGMALTNARINLAFEARATKAPLPTQKKTRDRTGGKNFNLTPAAQDPHAHEPIVNDTMHGAKGTPVHKPIPDRIKEGILAAQGSSAHKPNGVKVVLPMQSMAPAELKKVECDSILSMDAIKTVMRQYAVENENISPFEEMLLPTHQGSY